MKCGTAEAAFWCSISQHSTTWWSDQRAFHQSTQHHMVVRSTCIPPVNTVPHGGQINVHPTSQHSMHHMVVRSSCIPPLVRSTCIPPVNTAPHGGQINVHSISQHSTTWWSDQRALHQSTQCGQIGSLCERNYLMSTALRAQCELTLNRLTLTICMQFSTHHLIYGRYNSQIAAYATSEPTHGEC